MSKEIHPWYSIRHEFATNQPARLWLKTVNNYKIKWSHLMILHRTEESLFVWSIWPTAKYLLFYVIPQLIHEITNWRSLFGSNKDYQILEKCTSTGFVIPTSMRLATLIGLLVRKLENLWQPLYYPWIIINFLEIKETSICSSSEAEYRVVSSTTGELEWLTFLLHDLQILT